MATKKTKKKKKASNEPNPSGHTDTQIKKILKDAEKAVAPKSGLLDYLESVNVAPATYYYWKKKYGDQEKRAARTKKKEAA